VMPPEPGYVSDRVADLLKAADNLSSEWNGDKLLRLVEELNSDFRAGNAYASFALLRSILDHVPPLFGYTSFDQVASNVAWGRTEKAYIRQLSQAREAGHDAMHRPISKRPDGLDINHLPSPVAFDRFLRVCAERIEGGP
jgi:hypothetical protein